MYNGLVTDLVNFLKKNKLIFICLLILTIIPFFWFRPGEMDLGGDSSRLYFYDPLHFIKNFGLYPVLPSGTSPTDSDFFFIPFFVLLVLLKNIFTSGYLLILLFNIITLCGGFIGIYLIINEFLKTYKDFYNENSARLAGILGGFFYIFSPNIIANWTAALTTHHQVFLNPLMFYLILKYFLTKNNKFLWFALLISLIFSLNFSPASAPAFFAFYPLSIVFIGLYVLFIRKQKLPWKGILVGILLFFALHSFHIMPMIADFISPQSMNNARVFATGSFKDRTVYFFSTLMLGRPGLNLLSFLPSKTIDTFAIFFPGVIILGLLFNRQKQKVIILTAAFFLLTFYLATANISFIAVKLYSGFYNIPGFQMFRNFSGQWSLVYYFFYALLFGMAVYMLLSRLQHEFKVKILFYFLVIAIFLSSWNFINGSIVRNFGIASGNLRLGIKMDPQYEKTLSYIRSLSIDGRFLTLPLTSANFQIVKGETQGTYVGPSMISYLAGKNDFAGYTTMAPFSDSFLELAKAKDYESLKRLLGLLNIYYIYYNSDPNIYLRTLPALYIYLDKFLPLNNKNYQEFIKNISSEKIFNKGTYNIYKVDEKYYLPHFYIPLAISQFDQDSSLSIYSKVKSFIPPKKENPEIRTMYIDRSVCKIILSNQCQHEILLNKNSLPEIKFEKINAIKYKVHVSGATKPFFLVFSTQFNSNWKIFLSPNMQENNRIVKSYFGGTVGEGMHKEVFFDKQTFETINMPMLPETNHIEVNGYANAWYIKPEDMANRKEYELIIEHGGQRIFYLGSGITVIAFSGFIIWGISIFFKFPKKNI